MTERTGVNETKGGGDGPAQIAGLAKGASLNFVGAISRSILGFVFVFFLARILSQEEAGLFFLALNILMFLSILNIAGMDAGLRRYVAISRSLGDATKTWSYIDAALRIAAVSGAVLVSALWILADLLSESVLEKPELAGVFRIMGPYLLLYTFAELLLSVTQGYKKMQYWVLSLDIVFNVARILFLLVFGWLGFKLYGAVAAQMLGATIALGMAFVFFRRVAPRKPECTPSGAMGELVRFSLPVSIARLSNSGNGILETILLGYFLAAKDIAVYTVAMKVAVIGNIILASFNTVFSPTISELHARQRFGELAETYASVTRWAFTLSLPVYLFLGWYAEPVALLFGESYRESAVLIQILCAAQIINSLTGPSGNMLLMSGYSITNLWINVAGVAVTVGFILWLVPAYGVEGCALAVAMAITATNLMRVAGAWYYLKMHPFRKSFLKPLIAGMVVICSFALSDIWLGEYAVILSMLSGLGVGLTGGMLVLWKLGVDHSDRIVMERAVQWFASRRSHAKGVSG